MLSAAARPFLVAALLAATAAAQVPVLHQAAPLPGDFTPGEAGGVQLTPDVAAGGAGSLVVWIDHRAEFNSPLANQGGPDVFAMRLDAAGQPLDPVALRLPFAVGDKQHAKAAWNGSAWLVTWENQMPLGSSSFMRIVLGARIAGDGTLLDATPIVIKDDFGTTGATTAVASDGHGWVVTVQGTDALPGAIVALRVAADGTVVNPGGTVIVDLSSSIGRPDLEYANGRFLLVYASGHVGGLRFSSALAPLGGTFAVGTGSSGKPRAATDGTNFMVTWQNSDLGTSVRARTVNGANGVQGGVIQVTTLSNGEFNWEPDIAWNGSQWTVALRDSVDKVYRLARIAPGPVLLDPGGVALPLGTAPGAGRAVLAPVPGGVTVIFERQDLSTNWPGEILAARVDDDLTTSPAVALSLSAPRHWRPALAAGDGQFLLVYPAEQQGAFVIHAQRLDAFGAPLDPEPVELAGGNRWGHVGAAWNGQHWLVVWEDRQVVSFETDDIVLGMRVAADGSVLDAAPLQLMDGGTPDVAAQGGTFLVVSSDPPSGDPQLRHPYARRIGSDGVPLGPAVQLGGLFARYPQVAPLGSGWVVTWQRNFSHDNPNSVAHAALVAADGSAGGDFVIDGVAGFGGAAQPVVASAGETALFVWQDDFQGLAGRRIQADGSMQGAFAIAPLPALPARPSVAWNGEEYAVAWEDYRAQVGLWDFRLDVYAARVSADGVPLDGSGLPLAASQETELLPAVAGALGTNVFAWVEHMPDPPYATLRLNLRSESPWFDEGGEQGGAAGVPLFRAMGDAIGGQVIAFRQEGGPASASGGLIFGASGVFAPFRGGVMVPSPDLIVPIVSNTLGGFDADLTVPAGLPSALPLYVQFWFQDATAPFGFSGSNGLSCTLP